MKNDGISPVKVLFVSSGLGCGGAETMLFSLLQHMDRRRIIPEVISLTGLGDIGQKIRDLGIPVETSNFTRKTDRFQWSSFMRLCRKINSCRPDVVQTWQYHADLVAGAAARFSGIKAISWGVRNGDLLPGHTKRSTRIVRGISSALSHCVPKAILFNSESSRKVHIRAGYDARRTKVIPNGFDIGKYAPNPSIRRALRHELMLDEHTPLVGFVCRNDPVKNHEGFLRAASMINAGIPGVHYVLVGPGIDHDNRRLSQIIGMMGMGERVHMLGYREDISILMAAFDVLVSASHSEAFPNVLGEAMSCGVICVATNAGDSDQIIGDTGRVVPLRDMESLAEGVLAVLAMSKAERTALGMKARARIERKFEIGKIAVEYENYFISLTKEYRE